MPPERFDPVLDRGEVLFQFIKQHVSLLFPRMNGADYTTGGEKNNDNHLQVVQMRTGYSRYETFAADRGGRSQDRKVGPR